MGHHAGETSDTSISLCKLPVSKYEMSHLSPVKDQEKNINEGFLWQESEEEVEDMDIQELDYKEIEKACTEKDRGYVPQEQVSLLK